MRCFLTLAVLTVLQTNPVSAQTPANSSPSDVKLLVTTKSNQTTFRIGEVIPLELAFTSSAPDKYQLDTASYDRSGRLNEEKFTVEPSAGWDDPLALYFHAYRGFLGGGLRGSETLSPKPAFIRLELNEWIRFTAPGQYRVTVVSGRVSTRRPAFQNRGLAVTSNQLTLTIVPASKDWQAASLRAAIAGLSNTNPGQSGRADQNDPRIQATKTLRYLGTDDAAREMVRRLTGDSDWDFAAGLCGSPAREAGLDEMKKLLLDPNFPVTNRFLSTMSVIALPRDIAEDTPVLREKLEAQFRQDLTNAVTQKQGTALAVSNSTLIEDAAIRSHDLPVDVKQTLTRQLIENFDKLPVQKQAELIQYRWPALDHKAMLPLLRKVATRYKDFSELREMGAYEFNQASGSALMRWYEVAPDEARPAVLQEVLRPKPRFSASVLGVLPDKDLPEADQALSSHLNSQQNFEIRANVASLIHRYATPAIESQVTSFLAPGVGRMECAVQAPLLAYVLKVDPDAARPLIETAMAARGEGFSACNHTLLPEIAGLQNHGMLQDIAVKSLDDLDSEVVGSAALYLRGYGSSSAEDPLWNHFVAWSERWKGRESELEYVPGQKLDRQYEANAGSNLMQALGEGHGWLADEAKLRRLVDLSVGRQQRQQAEQYLRTWQGHPWPIQYLPFEQGQFQIAQYHERSIQAAKEKLAQFPQGSLFQWLNGGGQEGEQKAFQEILDFAKQHGLKITGGPERNSDQNR